MLIFTFILFFENIFFILLTEENKKIKYINKIRNLDSSSNTSLIINNVINFIIVGESGYSYISNCVDENGQLYIVSSKDSINYRYVYALLNNGRNFYKDSPIHKYYFNNSINTNISNSIIINSNNEKYFLNIIFGDYNFEILDLSSENLSNNIYKSSISTIQNELYINSHINPLFKLNGEENFIFGFYNNYTSNNYEIVLLKGSISVKTGEISYNISIKKNFHISHFSYSLSCFETTSYINCFNINRNGLLAIFIYDKELDYKDNFLIESNGNSYNSDNFRKGIFLKDEYCAYIFFQNDKTIKAFVIYLNYDNNKYQFITQFDITITSIILNNNYDLNDIIKINDDRFVFISTLINNKYLLLFLFDLYNNDNSIIIRQYYFDLDGYDMSSNLRLFLFKNYIGFSYCYGSSDNCGFRILNYANTTDYDKIDDFLTKLDIYNPLDFRTNIEIENNLFNYELTGIKIVSIPDNSKTCLSVKRSRNLEEIKKGDKLIKSSIIFSYMGNKTITNGDYIIEFEPIVSEKGYDEFNEKAVSISIFGENIDQESFFKSSDYIGRRGQFIFNLQHHNNFKCHGNCILCYKSFISDDEQYCISCIDDYYFIENTQNCFKDPIGYYFNEKKKVYSSCHSLCAYCISKEINNTYMNCLSCKDNTYKFYPKNRNCLKCPKYVNYEQTECIEEIPDKYYLYNSTFGTIEKCHELCSKCSNGPTENSMNCDYCIEGYYLKIDNFSIKNCFPNNEIISNNYVQKDLDKNIFYKCYELCGTCDDIGNSINMNCLTCIDELKYEYDEENKYCFPYISCDCSYYYYALDENELKTKICLQEGQFCPEILPFEIISTKECILTCSYENLLNLICKPSNIKVDIEQMKETFQNEIETNDKIIEDVLNNKFEDVTVIGYNSTYQITTTSNQEEKIIQNIDDAVSNIDLGECEKIIKKENNIDDEVSLIILKDDLKRNETISTQVEYEVYDPITRKLLNLSSCENTTIMINVPLDVNEQTLNLYKITFEQGYDIFDLESNFYHDVCTVYTSERGTDMILSDRRSDIFNKTPALCEDGCKYSGINTENKKVFCECTPKNKINSNTSEIVFTLKFFEEVFFKFDEMNYKVLGCFRLLSNKNNIIYNYGFYIMSFMYILFFILIPIIILKSPYQLKIKCYKLIHEKQNFMEKQFHQNKIKKSKEEFQSSLNNKEFKRCSKILEMNKENIKRKKSFQINKNNNNIRKFSLNKNNLNSNNNIRISKKHKTSNFKLFNFKDNQKRKTRNKRDSIKRYSISKMEKLNNLDNNTITKKSTDFLKSSNSYLFKKNSIKKNKNKISKNININFNMKINMNINNNKDGKIDEKLKIEEDNEEKEDKILYFQYCLNYLPDEEREKYFYEDELNQMDYIFAVEIDKRDFTQYYFSLLKKKQLLLFTFFNKDDYNIYINKISLFICSFSVYFMINAFFFNDETMHEIYKQNGRYNFIYQIPQIVYSTIISSVINVILKGLSLSQNGVLKIKQMPEVNKMIQKSFIMIKFFKLKMVIFNLLGFIILGFACYYITMFCAVYTNTQIHLLKDTFSSFCLSLLYPFGLYLIPGILRIPSLRSSKKDKFCLYKISQLFTII